MKLADQRYDYASLANQYAQLGDTQLLNLSADRASLTEIAAAALEAEITRRGLSAQTAKQLEPEENTQSGELPYRWGKFVGGSLVIQGLLSAAVLVIQREWVTVLLAALLVFLGLGVYAKKKFAVWTLETVTILAALIVAYYLFATATTESMITGAVELLAIIPQTIYFWKRRNELR